MSFSRQHQDLTDFQRFSQQHSSNFKTQVDLTKGVAPMPFSDGSHIPRSSDSIEQILGVV